MISALLMATQIITLNLATPLIETNQVSQIVVEAQDLISLTTPYIDENGDFGRKVEAGKLTYFFADYDVGVGSPISQIKYEIEGVLKITGNELDASATAIGIVGTWAGGMNELQTTLHAIITKLANILGQPDAWRDAYYQAILQKVTGQ